MTPSGARVIRPNHPEQRLRDLLELYTGDDPTTVSDFAWSTTDPCASCQAVSSTATISFDGRDVHRLCFTCTANQLIPTPKDPTP